MVDQAKRYVDTLPVPDANHNIMLQTEHTYSLDIEPFIRHGSAHCRCFCILRDKNDNGGFIGYPANFFDDLVKFCYETEAPEEVIRDVCFELSMQNLAPWPAPFVQLLGLELGLVSEDQMSANGGVPTLNEVNIDYDDQFVRYTLRNKHRPEVDFYFDIHFDGNAKCYKRMTTFSMWMEKNDFGHLLQEQ